MNSSLVQILLNSSVSLFIQSKNKCVYVDWFLVSHCVCRRHTHRPPSPVPSCVSMKSDQSMDYPANFSSEPVPSGLKRVLSLSFLCQLFRHVSLVTYIHTYTHTYTHTHTHTYIHTYT